MRNQNLGISHMSIQLWKSIDEKVRSRVGNLVRLQADWVQIFQTQTATPEEAAARIFGDLMCYRAEEKVKGWSQTRDGYVGDVQQMARALEAYVEYRKQTDAT
jgi:hypothetical protein